MRTALVSGGTGLVGRELLRQMLAGQQYDQVIVVTRRDIEFSDPRLRKIIADFDSIEKSLEDIQPDDVFCCLGTTMAKAGSRESFRKVDFEYPLALAKATHRLGAKQYLLVSALGADSKSFVYYNRVKGETEQAIRDVGFRTLHIFRPSLLLGERDEKRKGEDAAKIFYKVFGFLIPRKYKAIHGATVARAMLDAASRDAAGVFIHESGEMQRYS